LTLPSKKLIKAKGKTFHSPKGLLNSWINHIKNNNNKNVPNNVKQSLKDKFPNPNVKKFNDNKAKAKKYLVNLLKIHKTRLVGQNTKFLQRY